MIDFKCPHCGDWMEAGDDEAGETVPCDYCGAPVEVPPDVPDELFAADTACEAVDIGDAETGGGTGLGARGKKVRFECLNCRQEFTAPESRRGDKFRCTRCGSDVWIPYEVPVELAAYGKARGEEAAGLLGKAEGVVKGGTRDGKVLFSCPECETAFAARTELAGGRFKCAGCGEEIIVPDVTLDVAYSRAPKKRAPVRRFRLETKLFFLPFANPRSVVTFLAIAGVGATLALFFLMGRKEYADEETRLFVSFNLSVFRTAAVTGYIVLVSFVLQTAANVAVGQRQIASITPADSLEMINMWLRFIVLLIVASLPLLMLYILFGFSGSPASWLSFAAAGSLGIVGIIFGIVILVTVGEIEASFDTELLRVIFDYFRDEGRSAGIASFLMLSAGIGCFMAAAGLLPKIGDGLEAWKLPAKLPIIYALNAGTVFFFTGAAAVLGHLLYFVNEQYANRAGRGKTKS